MKTWTSKNGLSLMGNRSSYFFKPAILYYRHGLTWDLGNEARASILQGSFVSFFGLPVLPGERNKTVL